MDGPNGFLQELFSLSCGWGQKTGFRNYTNKHLKKQMATIKGKFNRVGEENEIGSKSAQRIYIEMGT